MKMKATVAGGAPSLFGPDEMIVGGDENADRAAELGQYMTRSWVAEELVAQDFGDLSSSDLVLDPTCGTGSFLGAIPDRVPCFGVEIDERLAQIARERTGRRVITGDFLSVEIDDRPTAIVGNGPFSNDVLEAILNRCYELLNEGGRAGFILPAAFYSLPSRVMRLNERFSFKQSLLPRYIYPRLSMPICWSVFWKDTRRVMIGFTLFRHYDAIEKMPARFRNRLASDQVRPWVDIVDEALEALGGEATLSEIFEYAFPYCPPTNKTPRDTIRRVCGEKYPRVRPGRFRKRDPVAAA